MSGIIKVINILKKNKIKLAIVTSKDINRTKLIVKKFNIPIKIIISPQNKLRGKPFPDQLKLAMKKLKCFQKETCYIGDMHVDYKAAKNSNIGFIFEKYGYGVKKNIYGKIINKPMDILKFI